MWRGCRQRASKAVLSLLPPAPSLLLFWGTQTLQQMRLSPQPSLYPELAPGGSWFQVLHGIWITGLVPSPPPPKVPCPVWLL